MFETTPYVRLLGKSREWKQEMMVARVLQICGPREGCDR
jgi:hypothetical protein